MLSANVMLKATSLTNHRKHITQIPGNKNHINMYHPMPSSKTINIPHFSVSFHANNSSVSPYSYITFWWYASKPADNSAYMVYNTEKICHRNYSSCALKAFTSHTGSCYTNSRLLMVQAATSNDKNSAHFKGMLTLACTQLLHAGAILLPC